MGELIKHVEDILSEEQIQTLQNQCNYDPDDHSQIFEIDDFVNGYALLRWGDQYSVYGGQSTAIIDSNGNFKTITLDKNVKLQGNLIVKLQDNDRGSYNCVITRIPELFYKQEFKGLRINKRKETAFFSIEVERSYFDYNTRKHLSTINHYIVNPQFEVIEIFTDTDKWGVDYDGYQNCHEYTERDFFFINEERRFIVFHQKRMVDSEDRNFYHKHMAELDPEAYMEYMDEMAPGFGDFFDEPYHVNEWDLGEEEIEKAILKSEKVTIWDEDEDEDDDIPNLEDIRFFFDEPHNPLYKDAFEEYYRELYGIIDCANQSSKQLMPFTDSLDVVTEIIWDRWRQRKEYEERLCLFRYSNGWSYENEHFHGSVLHNKFFDYPNNVKGLSLKYVYKFYPKLLLWCSDNEFILIPNKILNSIGNNEISRKIRINQEKHLTYAPIETEDDIIKSSEYNGVISTYQGKTLTEIIHSKGGTKHLVGLLEYSNLKIEKTALNALIEDSEDSIERKCYYMLLSIIERAEERVREASECYYEDDTDYERDTYYALGGDDYDRFRENGGSIDNMMDGLGL